MFAEFALPAVFPNDIDVIKALLEAQQNAHTGHVAAIRQDAHDYVIRILEPAVLARQRMFGASPNCWHMPY